jgi:signal transduction histidine kinase
MARRALPGEKGRRSVANDAATDTAMEDRVTELLRLNAELEAARLRSDTANRDKTRFLAAASHDVLQPLNAARLYAATLTEQSSGTALAGLAHSIEASLNAVEDILLALLDMTRIEAGAFIAEPVPFPVSDLIRKIALESTPLAREREVTLRLVHSSAVVFTDRALVGRIVQNLVSNAIKYTRPGGDVLVGCLRRGRQVRLDIIDTGIGFKPDQHQLILAEFSRLESGSRMARGLGLGLSIVDRLAKVLGLVLEIESVEGRGSRFSIYLPQHKGKPPIVVTPGPAPIGGRVDGLQVLCVDNEPDVLHAMEALFRSWDCDVRCYLSMREIDRDQLLLRWTPDIVVMDYHLDQTSGLDAVEWLRQNLGSHLPAVLATAERSSSVRDLAASRGIPLVTKPVKPAALRAAMTAAIGGRAPSGPGPRLG